VTDASDWKGAVGRNWAAEWVRTDRSFADLNTALVERIVSRAPGPAPRILDIGCGAGATSLALARRLPHADIVGIDLSDSLVEAARARSSETRVRFEVHDATSWTGHDWRPDLLVSRHGVMFFDDPVGAFSHLADIAAPAAQLVFSCFQSRELNAWATAIQALLPVPPAPFNSRAPGPFAFSEPDHVENILGRAGWSGIDHEAIAFSYVAGAGEDPVADAMDFFTRIGPAAPVIRTLEGRERSAFFDRLRQLLCNHLANQAVMFKAAAWIWTARR